MKATDEDEVRHSTLERFAERKVDGGGPLSGDQKALYYDIIATMAYLRRLEEENETLINHPSPRMRAALDRYIARASGTPIDEITRLREERDAWEAEARMYRAASPPDTPTEYEQCGWISRTGYLTHTEAKPEPFLESAGWEPVFRRVRDENETTK